MNRPKRLLGLCALLALALVLLSQRSSVQAFLYDTGRKVARSQGKPAPEIPASIETLTGAHLRLADLRGRVVLLHFFTFACGNCKHMVPRFAEWEQKFRSKGLAIVAVHTPETEGERDLGRLREFVRANRIAGPVLNDPDYAVWARYNVEAWPTMVVIDRSGIVRGTFVGDDKSGAIEQMLGDLMNDPRSTASP